MARNVAKILEQRSHTVPGKLSVTEHFFEVPRDYNSPSSGNLRLFARSVRKHTVPLEAEEDQDSIEAKKKQQLPWLIFFQGGPGAECPPPQAFPLTNFFLDKGYQMLFLDQRGTGLSTPIAASTLGLRGDDPVQVDYLKSFRADSIVKDAEAIRLALTADYPETKKQWSVIGQSFGGFCITTYLSFFPSALRECFLFGGLPPLVTQPDEVYTRTFAKMVQRNAAYYAKYPEDVARVKTIVRLLQRFGETTVRLPSGGALTARRFLQLGIGFGAHGGLDDVHDIVLRAANDLELVGFLTRPTTDAIESAQPFDSHILYTILHEPIYCQGEAARWSAERVMSRFPEFALQETLENAERPVYFTGEMIFPHMLDSFSELRKVREVAELLAATADWPMLYDEEQLARNEVPVYAAVYMDDQYVDYNFSMETARRIRGCKTYITNQMYHNAIRAKTDEVAEALWRLRCDSID